MQKETNNQIVKQTNKLINQYELTFCESGFKPLYRRPEARGPKLIRAQRVLGSSGPKGRKEPSILKGSSTKQILCFTPLTQITLYPTQFYPKYVV